MRREGIATPITTISSREFNQDASRAKKAALAGPVIITDRGKPGHVLMSYEEYRRLSGTKRNIADLLAMLETDGLELEIPCLRDLPRTAEL